VGKTTSTVSLGAALAGYGRRVLLVDFDPQGAIGASVVVVPYALFSGMTAFALAVALALVSLIVVGGLVGSQSGRGVVFSAGRQVLWGVGAAGVTYLIGSLVGVNVG
jgi:VIT1/CCC1 family predicted Fe2+/Mn2+ transporter